LWVFRVIVKQVKKEKQLCAIGKYANSIIKDEVTKGYSSFIHNTKKVPGGSGQDAGRKHGKSSQYYSRW
jgi:hypothetical protein